MKLTKSTGGIYPHSFDIFEDVSKVSWVEMNSCWLEQVAQVGEQLEGCLPDVCLPDDLNDPVRWLLAEN